MRLDSDTATGILAVLAVMLVVAWAVLTVNTP
jgi:hypothetical protein